MQHRLVLARMNNENGFVLIGALLIMTVLVLIGISATTSSILDLQISGSDRIHKETFYQADGGTQVSVRLIEESLGATSGFTRLDANNVLQDPLPAKRNNTIAVFNNSIWKNDAALVSPSDTSRDIAFYPGGFPPASPDSPRTNITLTGVTRAAEGEGLQMVAGYEGKGKGTAGGGGEIVYTVNSQHIGRSSSESLVQIRWRHVIGLELEGRY